MNHLLIACLRKLQDPRSQHPQGILIQWEHQAVAWLRVLAYADICSSSIWVQRWHYSPLAHCSRQCLISAKYCWAANMTLSLSKMLVIQARFWATRKIMHVSRWHYTSNLPNNNIKNKQTNKRKNTHQKNPKCYAMNAERLTPPPPFKTIIV